MAKFESHITIDKSHAAVLKEGFNGWQYSAIDDDPIMGQKPYCYLTCYDPYVKKLRASMEETCDLLEEKGIKVLRTKIERIVYDSKTGWNEIGR